MEATDGSIASRQSTPSTPAESPALPINTSRRTILASLTFLNQAISAKQLHSRVDQARGSAGQDLDVTIQDLIKTSTTFYTLTPQKLAEGDIAQLLANVEAFVLSVAKLLTVSAFAEVILWSLNDQDTRVSFFYAPCSRRRNLLSRARPSLCRSSAWHSTFSLPDSELSSRPSVAISAMPSLQAPKSYRTTYCTQLPSSNGRGPCRSCACSLPLQRTARLRF